MGTLEHEVKARVDSDTLKLLRDEAQKLERSEAFIIRRALRAYFGSSGAAEKQEATA